MTTLVTVSPEEVPRGGAVVVVVLVDLVGAGVKEGTSIGVLVVVVARATRVVVVLVVVVVAFGGSVVVVVVVVEVARVVLVVLEVADELAGCRGREFKVKTRTRSRRGLDHMSR